MKFKHYRSDIKEIVDGIGVSSRKLRNKKILLVGANGFLGKYFVKTFERFIENQKILFSLDCYDNHISSKKSEFSELSNNKYINFFNADINNVKITKVYDYIIYLAGIASPFIYKKYPLETLSVSYLGVKSLLEKCKKDKSEFIFFSSSEIYGNPDKKNLPTKEAYYGNVNSFGPRSCYDEGKRVGETLCYIYKNYYNCKVKIIRPFNVFGPLMNKKDYRVIPNIINKILNKNKILIHGNGKQTRTFCYITDAMTGFYKVILNGKSGNIYNIGNPYNEISMIKLVKIFDKLLNKKNKFKLINYPKHYPADEPKRRCPDITQAKNHLKYNPKISVTEGILRTLNYNNISAKK
jgi:UDP-glucuronate decarboxylase